MKRPSPTIAVSDTHHTALKVLAAKRGVKMQELAGSVIEAGLSTIGDARRKEAAK